MHTHGYLLLLLPQIWRVLVLVLSGMGQEVGVPSSGCDRVTESPAPRGDGVDR